MNFKEIFSQRLKMARSMRGFSLRALAEKLEYSRNTLHKYESGESMPNSEVLIKLAQVLQQPTDFFARPIAVQMDKIEFRKKSSLGKTKIAQIYGEADDYFERYQFLEESLGIETLFDNPVKEFEINTIDDVEIAALMIRNIWKLGYGSITNVLELLESKCFKIFLIDTDEKLDGFSGYRGSNPVIVLNERYTTDHLRFTALHEVGHLLLKIASHFSEKDQEKICHRFAGAMLIPQEVFLTEFGGHRDCVTLKELIDIKEEYGISIAAIMTRAKDLKLISDLFYKNFYIKYNKSGWRKQEPGTFAAHETSNRFEQLLQRAAATETLSLSKCASLAKKTLAEFRREVEFIL
jgi:Zn-dependent peptidase ImmA (M78 family)/DNA-binding XRE family transcriptional regulator